MKNLMLLIIMATICHVAFAQAPTISSFTPVSGAIGTPVVISGANFSTTAADNIVYFGAVKAVVQSAGSTSLTVIVPAGASYQPISVAVNNLIAYTVSPFTVTRTGSDLDFATTSFAGPTSLAGDDNITAADIDGDNRIDLICGYATNKITVYRNTTVGGSISFTPVDIGGSYYLPMSTRAGDVNGDGLLDLVAVGVTQDIIWVLKNTSTPGNISFGSPVTLTTGPSPRKVAIRDLDNDGKADIACTHSSTSALGVFRNTSSGGNISFAARAEYPNIGASLEGIAIGDLNGDKKPDIVGGYVWSSMLFVYENTSTPGSISFAVRPETFYTFSSPSTVAIADIDGDGWADMMSSNSDYSNKNAVGIWRNKGTTPLSFYDSRNVPLPVGGEMELSDLDGDGRPDIVSASRFDAATHIVSVLKNLSYPGTILFAPAVTYATNGTNTVTVADLDNDGFADIAAGDFKSATLSVYKNQLITTPCVAASNAYNITANGPTSFCEADSVELYTTAHVDVQWFYNNQLLPDERGTTWIKARKDGAYTMRSLNGACYSAPSNAITVTTFPIPPKPVLSQLNDTTFCENGNVNFVSNLNNNNQWFKNNTLINNATGTSYNATTTGDYFVRVMNGASCYNYSDTVSVTVLPAPATPVAIVTGNLTFCIGDSVRLQSTAASGNQWYLGGTTISNATNQQFLAKTAGSYTVKTTDANKCTSAASPAIIVITNPLPTKPVITSGGTSLSTTAGFASYVWYLNNVILAGATGNQYSTTQNGVYKVTVSDNNGCKNTSDDFNYVTTGLNDVYFPGYTIQLYPNPVINELQVQVEQTLSVNGSITMAVTDITGKQIHTQTLKQGNNTVYFKHLAPGIYMVMLKNGNSEKTIKILKTL